MRARGVIVSLAIHGLALTGLSLLGKPAAAPAIAPAVEVVVISEPPPVPVLPAAPVPQLSPTTLTATAPLARPRRLVSRRPMEKAVAAPVAPIGKASTVEASPVEVAVAAESPPVVPVAIAPVAVTAPQSTGKPEGGAPVRPRLLPPAVAEGQLLINPQDERYRPVIPPALRRSGVRATPLLKVCVSEAGTVQGVTVLQPSDAVLDPLIVAKVKTYVFRPSLHEGRPVPFCYAREFKLIVE